MSEKNQPHDETQPVRPTPAAPSGAPSAAPSSAASASASAPSSGAPAAATPAAAPDQPAAEQPAPTAAYAPAPVPADVPPGRGWGRTRRWRDQAPGDRAYGLGALVAAALAGVIIGGVGTAVFHAVTDDHGPGDRFGQHGPMGERDGGGRGPMFGGGPGAPGQLQPTTPPDDDGSGS